jgi:hypothetical protein
VPQVRPEEGVPVLHLADVAQAMTPDYVTLQLFVFVNALGTSGVHPLAFFIGKLRLFDSHSLTQSWLGAYPRADVPKPRPFCQHLDAKGTPRQ